MKEVLPDLSRRRLLLGGAAVGAAALVAGCTSNKEDNANTGTSSQTRVNGGNNAAPGKALTMGFRHQRPITAGSVRSPTMRKSRPPSTAMSRSLRSTPAPTRRPRSRRCRR